jgi:hypothetical protein
VNAAASLKSSFGTLISTTVGDVGFYKLIGTKSDEIESHWYVTIVVQSGSVLRLDTRFATKM